MTQDLEHRSRAFLDRTKKELMFCRIAWIAPDGTSIRYSIPMDSDASGDLVFGVVYQGPRPGWTAELAFVPRVLYLEEAAPPLSLGVSVEILGGMDMNRDGDMLDAFLVGQVEQRIYDSAGLLVDRSVATDLVVLAMVGQSPAGDVDADGILDPLFSVLDVAGSVVPAALIAPNGVRLRVTVAHWNFQDLRKSFIMRKLSDECVFRNSQ